MRIAVRGKQTKKRAREVRGGERTHPRQDQLRQGRVLARGTRAAGTAGARIALQHREFAKPVKVCMGLFLFIYFLCLITVLCFQPFLLFQ